MKRLLLLLFPLLLCLGNALPASAKEFVEGTHYTRLPQAMQTADPARIEVVEVFWYGCIHCFHLDPLIKEWQKSLPADVDFHRSPAVWGPPMDLHAQTFYAAAALGVLDKIHEPLFEALNVQHRSLKTEDEIAAFFVEHGVNESDFRKALNSFGVKSKARQADLRARSYGIEGTPEFVVNGKYRVSARSAGGQAQMLQAVDFLVAKERAARAGTAAN